MSELLEKIKAMPGNPGRRNKNPKFTDEELIEISLAWIKGEVAMKQITAITEMKGSNFYNAMAIGLRNAYNKGQLIIK